MSSLEKRITKHGHTYILRFRDNSGRQHSKSLKTSLHSMAKKIQAKVDADLAAERWGLKDILKRITLQDYRRLYIEQYSAVNKAPRTVTLDNGALKILERYLGDRVLGEITSFMLERFKLDRTKNVKPVTLNIELRHLKAAFNKAKEWGYISENPFNKVQQLKIASSNLPKFLSKEQIKAFMSVIDNHVHFALFSFYIGTGCRRSEALNLRWSDIDFENNTVIFRITKSGKARVVPLRKKLISLLLDFPSSEESLFPFESSYVSRLFKKYAHNANLPPELKLHSLRHTFLTYAVSTSKNLRGVQTLAGHSSVTVTEGYTHLLPEELRSIVENLPY